MHKIKIRADVGESPGELKISCLYTNVYENQYKQFRKILIQNVNSKQIKWIKFWCNVKIWYLLPGVKAKRFAIQNLDSNYFRLNMKLI